MALSGSHGPHCGLSKDKKYMICCPCAQCHNIKPKPDTRPAKLPKKPPRK